MCKLILGTADRGFPMLKASLAIEHMFDYSLGPAEGVTLVN
jgi:hypothetical protein